MWLHKDGARQRQGLPSAFPRAKVGGMVDLLAKCGMQFRGRQHAGIDDARNMARVAQYMVGQGFEFTSDMLTFIKEEEKYKVLF